MAVKEGGQWFCHLRSKPLERRDRRLGLLTGARQPKERRECPVVTEAAEGLEGGPAQHAVTGGSGQANEMG